MPRTRNATKSAEVAEAAHVFAALGDETRLRLVGRLSGEGALSIARLTAGSRVSRQAVTKHLRVMEAAGLLRVTRRGRESIWALERERIEEARRSLDRISMQWDLTLARLQAFVERA